MADHKNLAEALAAFQAELPKLTKDEQASVKGQTKDGRSYDRSYGYADLAQVVETVLPVLGKHGLSVTSKNVFTADGYVLKVKLLHESGEFDEGDWPLPDARRSGPQDIGSAMTYGRRYLTLALSGAYPGGEDDDGAKAQAQASQSRWEDARPQRPKQITEKTEWSDDEMRELFSKIEYLEIGNAVNGYDWMASKNLHARQVEIHSDLGTQKVTASDVLACRIADLAGATPPPDLQTIASLRTYAEARGLLKFSVSESTTLDEELSLAHDALVAAEAPTSGD